MLTSLRFCFHICGTTLEESVLHSWEDECMSVKALAEYGTQKMLGHEASCYLLKFQNMPVPSLGTRESDWNWREPAKGTTLVKGWAVACLMPFLQQLWARFWVLDAEPSVFHTSSHISQIVYALLFHNRCQHFFFLILVSSRLVVSAFPSWI